MTRRSHVVALATVFAITGAGAIVVAQQRPIRVDDQQARNLLSRLNTSMLTFRASFDQAIDRSRINGSRAESDINLSVNDFQQATDRLRDRVVNRQANAADVEDVMRRAGVIDRFMTSNTLGAAAERDWTSLRGDLDELARAYGVTSNWPGSQSAGSGSRVSDQQIEQLLARTKRDADQFRRTLDPAVTRSRIDTSRQDDNIPQFMTDFGETTNHLSDHLARRQVVTNDVEDVLRRGASIDGFMQRQRLPVQVKNSWLTVRRDLDELAHAYDVPWNWSDPRYAAEQPNAGLYHRLTGTYQLDTSRGDDPGQAVEQATRTVPGNQRQGVSRRLLNRLNAPDSIAIDRNESSVSMASSQGQRVTFEADGQVRAEQGTAGSTLSTRATLFGDQLSVTTTGSRGNDFAVTFEPIDEGRNLRVTRRLYDASLRQPVTVQSFYRKSSDEAQWDIYSTRQGERSQNGSTGRSPRSQNDSAAVDLGVPDGTRFVATLDNAISTRTAKAEDRFALTARSPSPYEGAVIEGTISNVNASGRVSGRADLALNFETIRMRNGTTHQFAGIIEGVRTASGETISVDKEGTLEDNSQTEKTVQRGAIGAALGAIIGAISGGGKGAAIGAAVGAGGGAGTVVAQGRDQLDLARGTEVTIMSVPPGSRGSSSSGPR
jgi:hypothetical protein